MINLVYHEYAFTISVPFSCKSSSCVRVLRVKCKSALSSLIGPLHCFKGWFCSKPRLDYQNNDFLTINHKNSFPLTKTTVKTIPFDVNFICEREDDVLDQCDSQTHPSRHLTSVGRQIDVRLRRHNDVGFRLILKVCLTSKTDVILTSKTDVILTSEKQRWFDVSNVTS